jgi:hypothetical protein
MQSLKYVAHFRLLRAKLCIVVYVMKMLKEITSPYTHMKRNISHSNFWSCVRYGVNVFCNTVRYHIPNFIL